MDYFPVFLDLRGRRCLVVGSGMAAAGRAASLVRAGAAVEEVQSFAPECLAGAALVCVAGTTPAVGEAVARECAARGIPVNVMDEPRLCSFLMPALVERGPLVVAIGTGGAAPMLARLIRRWLERILPERLGALAALAGRYRPLVKCRLVDGAARRRFWHRFFTGETARRALAGDDVGAAHALLQALDAARGAEAGGEKAA
jgi:uroporphyrin-III C-methyltransferase / precorrin-2 dehydrogenase / sirohydrochlorin ferrochelatase